MHVLDLRWRKLILATAVCLTCTCFVTASDEPTLTKEQIKQFLLTAKVVKSQDSKKGITNTSRLTLSDGTVTHDASFQSIDEHKPITQLTSGSEVNFVDSYKYNIAAYQLAELLGIDDMLPVYVERKWKGNQGSLSWWLPVNRDLKNLFKSAAISASTRPGPWHDFYVTRVEKGMRPTMARLTLARKIAAVSLTIWKKGVSFDPKQLHRQAA